MKSPAYIIERHEHGWLVCTPAGAGLPVESMTEVTRLFPQNAQIDNGIANHYKVVHDKNVILAVGRPKQLGVWRSEITVFMATYPPETRWYGGTDVGLSSLAIFAALAQGAVRETALNRCQGRVNTPTDSSDFGRCQRLVETLGWRDRLPEVAAAYPDTKWPAIIARWDELVASPDKPALLRQIHEQE